MKITTIMPFGKYKGEPVEDIPVAYLEWMLENASDLAPSLQAEMEAQVKLKRGEGVARPADHYDSAVAHADRQLGSSFNNPPLPTKSSVRRHYPTLDQMDRRRVVRRKG